MILSAWNFQNQQRRGAKPKVFNEAGKRRKVPIFDVSQVAHAGWGLSRAGRAGVSSALRLWECGAAGLARRDAERETITQPLSGAISRRRVCVISLSLGR
jgi:hypothetical protein